MFGLSPSHIIILLIIVVLIFGTKKLRGAGRDLGEAVKGFKDGMKDGSTPDSAATPPNGQVASPAVADKTTIDVEAKHKS